jgi:hypothetical protein
VANELKKSGLMTIGYRRLAILLLILPALIAPAAAIAPPYVSDRELAAKPIIVVARWAKAKMDPHLRYGREPGLGKVIDRMEVRTELVIERVIQGDVTPGTHKLLVESSIGWGNDGRFLGTTTSTMLMGEVEDVTKPNLWFLSRGRSWDAADKTDYFSLDTYRGVQPPKLEPYFRALLRKDWEEAVGELLDSPDETTVMRCLELVAGGQWPWPYWSQFDRWHRGREKPPVPLTQHANRVKKLLDRPEPTVRQMAAAVYAFMTKDRDLAFMRSLLDHKDPEVRGIAIGVLAEKHDPSVLSKMEKAAQGVRDPTVACAAIKRVAAWGDVRLPPTLIRFLQTDTSGGTSEEGLLIPALKARDALRKMTGYTFPTDVRAGLDAWERVRETGDRTKRRQELTRLLGDHEKPLHASIVNRGGTGIVITNRSGRPIYLAKQPTMSEYNSTNISGAVSDGIDARDRRQFALLKSGASMRLPVTFPTEFILSNPSSRKVTLWYVQNGNKTGVNAWIGRLDATFGPGWKEPPRKVRHVVMRWPNGKLRPGRRR